MEPLREKKEISSLAACLVLLFGGLFLLFWLFPVVGDDWYREALGASLRGPADLIRRVASNWAGANGRILGNVLAYTAGNRPILRELMRALFTLALIFLLSRLTRLEGWRGLLLCAAGAFALPRDMFCQIYPWAAGFFNYVPPVVMLLAALLLVRPVLDGGPLPEGRSRGVALLLLGFGQQLFIENNTLYALCASFVLLVWYRLERRKWSPCLLAFFLGCMLGAVLLFASPSYRLIGGGSGAYQAAQGGGLSGLLSTARANLPEVARWFILRCPVLYGLLTILALPLGWRKRSPPDILPAALLVLGCAGLAYGRFKPTAFAALWWLALTAALWRWLPGRQARARALFLWLSAPVAAGPLLFVNPIGPRCLFLSYLLMLAVAGVLLRELEPHLSPQLSGLGAAALAAAVFCFYLRIYLPLHQLELDRTRIITAALEAGATEVSLPAYHHGGYLWDADSAFKMELYYYHEQPGDLAIKFVPGG